MTLNYCMNCAAPLKNLDGTEYVCTNGHTYWNEPVGATAVVLMNDKQEILVSKRALEPHKGKYDLPGGFLHFNEDPINGAVREIQEETGLTLQPESLEIIDAYSALYVENESVCDLIVFAKRWEGTPEAQDDSESLEWKPLSFLESEEFQPDYTRLRQKLESKLY